MTNNKEIIDDRIITQNIEIFDDKIVINHRKIPFAMRTVLTVLIVICALFPIVITYRVLLNESPDFLAIAFSFLIFWGIGFAMLRTFLWNIFGKEIIELSGDKIIYLADFKYFKEAKQELDPDGLEVDIIHDEPNDKELGRLRLKNNSKEIETVLQTNLKDLQLIEEKITIRYYTSAT